MKRLFDIAASAFALLLLAPVLVIIGVLIRISMGSPVLFRHVRPGLHGAPFCMIKFRTMREAHDAQGRPLPNTERITPLGRFLRASSLDELPELWNVLRGDMSLVGPRPLLMDYLPLYSPEQARRHDVRPGITGWAQVNGRNALTWEQKFAFDTWYVDNQTFWFDVKVLFLTLYRVLRRDGINLSRSVTAERFQGSSREYSE